jgi:hypothetical protein
MKPISINEYLNKDNPWSHRLLGIVNFKKNRNIQLVENEYNLDKYGKLMDYDFKTLEEYKAKEIELAGTNKNANIKISFSDDIFDVSLEEARTLYYKMITDKVAQYTSEKICELGCGYGFNLSFLGKQSYGGEYSKNAVSIGKKLGLDIWEFNYYQDEDYNFLKENTTIITAHSIEQIPDARIIISNLEKQKSKINYVIHFEPTIIEERDSLLGLLRNKYIEMNDYNRNLISVLKNNSSIEIIELKHDIFGLNPLNSTNLIVWKFKN